MLTERGGFMGTVCTTAKESTWPSSGPLAQYYECDAINDENDPLIGISLPFSVIFLETRKGENGAALGDSTKPSQPQNAVMEIDRLEPHGGRYRFYLWNETGQFAMIKQPETASLEAAKKPGRVKVSVKQPSNDNGPRQMQLGPRFELLK